MQELREENKGLFTIVIPSYNHEEYVLDCLESIKRQKYSKIEIIIVDDHSADNTFELEKKWASENQNMFQNVVVMQNEQNMGVVKTVNKGLHLSNGEYIIRLASDDCLLDDAVENIVNEYCQNPKNGMICFEGVMGEKYSEVFQDITLMPGLYGDIDHNKKQDMFEELYKVDFISAPGCVIKRETYLTLGVYDENSWIDDWEYYLRVAKNLPIFFSKEKVVFFRQVPTSLSHSPNIRKRKMMNQGEMYVLQKYKKDVDASIAKKVMHVRINRVLREVLEWREKEFLSYVLEYMKENKVSFTARSYVKYILFRLYAK